MKKIILTLVLFFMSFMTFAQTAYDKIMTEKINKLEKENSTDEYNALYNDFIRIGDKEKNQWLPYYYAAYCAIKNGRVMMSQKKNEEMDNYANIALENIGKAQSMEHSESAELFILEKMAHSLKMLVDPQALYMTEGKLAQNALQNAIKADPNNPRIALIQAEDLYFTPPQFGGDQKKANEKFVEAKKLFGSYQLKSNLYPNWGEGEVDYFISKMK